MMDSLLCRISVDSGYESSVISGGSSEHRSMSVDGGNAALRLGQTPNRSSFGDAVNWSTPAMDPYGIRKFPMPSDVPPGFPPASQPKGG